jgi:antitoxin MazE
MNPDQEITALFDVKQRMAILWINVFGSGGEVMATKIQKWGNSHGVRLSSQVLQEAHLKHGDEVDISVRDGIIIVTPRNRIRGKYRLEDLVAQIPEDYQGGEVEWGPPSGREVW